MSRSRSIKVKILTSYFALSIFIIFSIIGVVFYQVKSLIRSNILESNINFAMELIDNIYKGEWKLQDNKLYKGEKIINEDYQLVDNIKRITNADITIFLNDTRISTTIEEDGVRKIGTKAEQKVVDSVIINGESYSGTADVLGKKYITIYMPIKNASNEVIGMLFVGYPDSHIVNIIEKFIMLILLVSFGLLVIGCIGFSILISRDIIKPIRILDNDLISVSELDLTVEVSDKLIKRNDEIGKMFKCLNTMVHNLRSFTANLSNGALSLHDESQRLSAVSEEMVASSEEVASRIDEVSNGAMEQTDSINKILSIVEELSNSIEGVYGQVCKVREEVISAEDKARHGKDDLDRLIESIENIKSAFNLVVDKVQNLNKSVANISSIADAIKSISEQTNLLALNAAIESARAGEAGRGFAVVADEIRKLAEESKKSTNEIIETISSIQEDTNEVIVTSGNVSKYIENQTESIENTFSSFEGIIDSVDNITPLIDAAFENVNDMIRYKDETSSKITSINQKALENASAAQEINASTEELASSSEEVASSAQKLAEMATDLKNIASKFKI